MKIVFRIASSIFSIILILAFLKLMGININFAQYLSEGIEALKEVFADLKTVI